MKHEINKIGQLERVSFINFIYSRMLTTYSDTNETENTILNFYPSRHQVTFIAIFSEVTHIIKIDQSDPFQDRMIFADCISYLFHYQDSS